MGCGKKSVVRVAQRVAALVPVQGLSSLFSNVHCLFDPSCAFVWFSILCHGLCTLTVLQCLGRLSLQPSVVKRVSDFGLRDNNNHNKWRWWMCKIAAYRLSQITSWRVDGYLLMSLLWSHEPVNSREGYDAVGPTGSGAIMGLIHLLLLALYKLFVYLLNFLTYFLPYLFTSLFI